MIRPMVGLAVTCFLVGCGTNAPPETTMSTDSVASVEEIADAAAAKVSEAKVSEAATSTRTVAYKVPGMT